MSAILQPLALLFRGRERGESRSDERLRAHYLVERQLADKVRAAKGPAERRALFATLYEELFRLVPDHPRLLKRADETALRERDIGWDMAQLRPYLKPGCVFLEVGAGDCELAATVAQTASRVHAVDICDQTRHRLPKNVTVAISDGQSVPVPEGSVDLAFSDQLMEHLHPDDAMEQLRNIHRALKPGGIYVCITPNRLYGPSDISAYFDDEARGFHLKEYTVREIRRIFRAAGFPASHVYVGARGWFVRSPAFLVEWLESALEVLPPRLRRRVAGLRPVRAMLGVRVAAIKG